MPRYDFKCPECGSTEEITASIHAADEIELICHICDTQMKRVYSPVGAIFRGDGWAGGKPPVVPARVVTDDGKLERIQ